MPLYTTMTGISASQLIKQRANMDCNQGRNPHCKLTDILDSLAFADFLLLCHNSLQSRRSHLCLTFSANSSRILLACKRNLKSWDSNTRHRFCQSIELPFSTVSSAIVMLIIHLGCRLRCSKNPTESKGEKKYVF